MLAIDRVVFAGQPVAAVAADDLGIADEALDLIEVEYEVLPVSADPLKSMLPDAPRVADQGTYSGTPLVAAAAVAQLEILKTGEVQRELNRLGDRLRGGLNQALKTRGIPGCVYGASSIFRIFVGATAQLQVSTANADVVPGGDDEAFAKGLFAATHVTVLPGQYLARDAHGTNPGRGYVRMALVPDLSDCVEAAQRIVAFCG